jgi:hypothetical protein
MWASRPGAHRPLRLALPSSPHGRNAAAPTSGHGVHPLPYPSRPMTDDALADICVEKRRSPRPRPRLWRRRPVTDGESAMLAPSSTVRRRSRLQRASGHCLPPASAPAPAVRASNCCLTRPWSQPHLRGHQGGRSLNCGRPQRRRRGAHGGR